MGHRDHRVARARAGPAAVKVVLLGERYLYYLLHALDPDFRRLFGVVADFDEAFDRTAENSAAMAGVIAGLARHDALLPLERGAVARTIDHAARMAEDARKLTRRHRCACAAAARGRFRRARRRSAGS